MKTNIITRTNKFSNDETNERSYIDKRRYTVYGLALNDTNMQKALLSMLEQERQDFFFGIRENTARFAILTKSFVNVTMNVRYRKNLSDNIFNLSSYSFTLSKDTMSSKILYYMNLLSNESEYIKVWFTSSPDKGNISSPSELALTTEYMRNTINFVFFNRIANILEKMDVKVLSKYPLTDVDYYDLYIHLLEAAKYNDFKFVIDVVNTLAKSVQYNLYTQAIPLSESDLPSTSSIEKMINSKDLSFEELFNNEEVIKETENEEN